MAKVREHRKQIAAKVESTAGTWESDLASNSTAKTYADFEIENPRFQQNPLAGERPIMVNTFSRPENFRPGVSTGTLSFTVELAGHNSNSGSDFVQPPVARLLSACGMAGVSIGNTGTLTSWGGTNIFEHGENVTGASTLDATVFGSAAEDVNTSLWFEEPPTAVGTNSETLTGGTSGATADAGTFSTYDSYGLKLQSLGETNNTLSMVYIVDGRDVQLMGCVGTAQIVFTAQRRPLVNFTFTGVLYDVNGSRSLMEGSNARTVNAQVPPPCVNMGLVIDNNPGGGNTNFSPSFSEMTLDLGNQVVMRPDANATNANQSSTVTAFDYGRIIGRNPTVTWDQDWTDTGKDYENLMQVGAGWHVAWSVGTTAGNIWEFRAPAGELTDRQEGEREGYVTHGTTMTLRAGKGPSSQFGENSEFVIINR